MNKDQVEIFYPKKPGEWRDWLDKNHNSSHSVWVVFFKKASEKESITWREAVDVALCFGWIDSKKIAIDAERSHQFFSRRKPMSTWSKINKSKIEELIEKGLMEKAGFESIETAKQNGSWTILDAVEELTIPNDLEIEFSNHPHSKDFFLSLSKSVRKAMLQWIVLARRADTRQRRITEIAVLAGKKQKPKQF